jgi:aspartate/methionine/tyrosine aminotransferase
MRTEIVHIGAGELSYEIRGIVRVAEKLQKLGVPVNLENIGDPVAKGQGIPDWMKEIVSALALEDDSYAYCPTQGLMETRRYLAGLNNRNGGVPIDPEDIIFFNGLGDAIGKVYGLLRRTARVIMPSPTYTTHSSGEAAHAGVPPVCYPLDPHNGWQPDLTELRRRVKYNPAVAGILLINPDNPTGAVFPEETLQEIVAIADEFDLFIIADEIYQNLCFSGFRTRRLADVIGRVPGISMKGISKELPWPGARCGWIEVYNRHADPGFASYIDSILNSKMLEVCSTSLPQKAIPRVFEHPLYPAWLEERCRRYERFANIAAERLSRVPGIRCNRANGAFYMSVVFDEGALNHHQTLPVANREARELVERLTAAPGTADDKRFVYYLLASTGLCVVPLTSFCTELNGFRFTLLDPDEDRFRATVETLALGITDYVQSHYPLAMGQ